MRFFKVFAAHGYGQLVTVVTNFILPSVLAGALKVGDFGFWIMVSALSQTLLFSDFGFSLALSNYLAMEPAFSPNRIAKRKGRIEILFFVLGAGVLSAFFLSLLMTWVVYLFRDGLSESWYLNKNPILIVFFILLVAALNPAHNIIVAIFRSKGFQSHGIIITNTLRLIEGCCICLAAVFSGSLYVVSSVYLCVRFFSVVIFLVYVAINYGVPRNRFAFLRAYVHVWNIYKAASSHFTSGVAQNISIHAPTLLLGYFFGAASAASYSITRTLCRIPVQVVGITLNSISPKLTEIGLNSINELKKITNILLLCVLFALIIAYTAIHFYGVDIISSKWMHGKIIIDYKIYFLVAAGTAFSTLSLVITSSGNAINSPLHFGIIQVVFFAIAIIFVMLESNHGMTVNYFASVFLIPELISLIAIWLVFSKKLGL